MMTDHTQIRLSGSGGQGLLLSARILAKALVDEGMLVSQSQSYEPTSRGGLSRADLIIGNSTPDYPLATKLDHLLVLDECASKVSDEIIGDDTIIITDSELVKSPPKGSRALPLIRTALELGNLRIANIVALGALIGLNKLIDRESLRQAVSTGVPEKFRELNLEAVDAGFELADNI